MQISLCPRGVPQRPYWIFMAVLAVLYVLVAAYTFEPKVLPYGDNTTYFILGKALAQGEGYREIHNPNRPLHHHYPPGYPVFLSLNMHVFGQNFLTLKVVNMVVLGISILAFFSLGVRLFRQVCIPGVAAVLTIFNPSLLLFGSSLMSEVFFLLLTVISFHAYLSWKAKPSLGHLLWLGISLAATFYTRSLGLGLVVGVLGAILWQRKWKDTAGLMGVFIAYVLPWTLRNRALGSSYTTQLMRRNPYRMSEGMMELADWPRRIWINLERYLTHDLKDAFFSYVTVSDYSLNSWYTWLPGLLILFAVGYGLWKFPQHRVVFLLAFLATGGILLLWPEVWFGVRFVLPLVPLLALFGVAGGTHALAWLWEKTTKQSATTEGIPWPALAFLFLLVAVSDDVRALHRDTGREYNQAHLNYFSAGEWIDENTPEDAVICARKPSLLYIHCQRPVVMFARTSDTEALLADLKAKGVTHVVADNLGYQDVNDFLVPAILTHPDKFDVLIRWENPVTALIAFYPEGVPGASANP